MLILETVPFHFSVSVSDSGVAGHNQQGNERRGKEETEGEETLKAANKRVRLGRVNGGYGVHGTVCCGVI